MEKETSPLTGIINEEKVFLDFGEHEGKTVFEISDTHPDYYQLLIKNKNQSEFSIKRTEHKMFKLYLNENKIDKSSFLQ
jgi:hypothetical protein